MEENKSQEEQLELLNQFTRRKHTLDEVYLFDVKLCDNEIDRDRERFSLEALRQLQPLFVGKTGIFDHNPTGENQTARIYATELCEEPGRRTAAGETYTYLCGHAYMVRTEKNKDLIREIDGGIKKEVSISCLAKSRCCSVCGCDWNKESCVHRPGETYDGVVCHGVLGDIRDAYEWSFVAIPAQREAGVTKRYSEGNAADLERLLRTQQSLLEETKARVQNEIVSLKYLTDGVLDGTSFLEITRRLELPELFKLYDNLRGGPKPDVRAQLKPEKQTETFGEYRMG